MIEQAVVLAAGRGTRLGALTETRAKAMLPVLGKPIIARIMDRMAEAGIWRFVVVVSAEDQAIRAYFDNGAWRPDCAVRFAQQPAPLGTADALRRAAPYIDGPFLFSACDNLTPPGYVTALRQHFDAFGGDLVLSLLRATPAAISRSAGVEVEGERVVRHVEKPPTAAVTSDLLSVMIYGCSLKALEALDQVPLSPRGEREFAHVITQLIDGGSRVGYRLLPWRLHLTHEHDLLAINQHYLGAGDDAQVLRALPHSVQVRAPVRIEAGARVGEGAVIGPGVYLEAGCEVGAGARVSDSVVLRGGAVAPGAVVSQQVVAGGGPAQR